MFNRYFSIAAAGVVLGMLSATAASADVLDDIKKKGVLVVGTKADYRPFGFLDPSGKIVGFEPDLAADVAKRLGVKLELVPVVASNRIQFLQQGKIDLMIATMSDTPERRKIVDIIEPNYYGSGTNILAPKSAGTQELGRAARQEGVPDPGRVLQQGAAGEIRRRRRRVPGHCRGLYGAQERQLRGLRL